MDENRRLKQISSHLMSRFPKASKDDSLEVYRSRLPAINSVLLQESYFGEFYPSLVQLRKIIASNTLFNHYNDIDISRESLRGRDLQRLAELYLISKVTPEQDKIDPFRKLYVHYALAEFDQATSTRLIVHTVLYLDTIHHLGTAKHYSYLTRGYSLQDYGCFAMTELGHGSNVAALETTATYNPVTHSFTLNSPTQTSAKWWIGAAGKTANTGVIFAQLIIGEENKGVHGFLVSLRDYDSHESLPGVVLGDCGKKAGLEGIDNGFILFKNYSVPYDALLDRYSSIDTKGNFLSSIKNKEKRLGLMLGGLIRGRVSVAFGCDINMRNGLTIALRFSAIRKQFTNSTGPENYLLDYQLQKYRLIPHLARMLATRPAVLYITRQYKDLREKVKTEPECEELAEFHALLSVIKAMSSWYSVSCMQVCRETTGGLGYSAYAGLARIRSGNDVQVTWEGDNYVLIQQSGKFLLKQATKIMNGVNIKSERTKALNINFDQVKAFRVSFETKEQLLNVDLLISLFVHRLNYTLSDCMVKLQENLQVSTDMVLAWNNSQIHYVQDMSKAYGELFLLTEFKNSLQALTAQDENTGNTIKKFFYLYALYTLQDNLVTFLGESMTKNQAVLIRKTVVELCDELGESSLQVIDALAAPDESLGSVIGVADGQIYEKMIETVENSKRVYEKPAWLPILRDIRDKGLISNN